MIPHGRQRGGERGPASNSPFRLLSTGSYRAIVFIERAPAV